MKKKYLSYYLAASLACAGCASSGGTTMIGLASGAAAGGAIGVATDQSRRGRYQAQNGAIGAAVGGIVGAFVAFLAHPKDSKQAPEEAPTKMIPGTQIPEYSKNAPQGAPVLAPAQVETRYIDDQVRGNTFIPGHLEYQIVQPSQWSHE